MRTVISSTIQSIASKGRRPAKLTVGGMVQGLVFHVMQSCGTFYQNLNRDHGVSMSDSALSERRQSMGTKPWLDGIAAFLGKDDKYVDMPETSYRSFRLIGIDGTTFTCGNTPSFQRTGTKVKSRRGDSDFFRIPCVTLCELSEHRSLAITIGEQNESEEDLLIADRYYGNGIWLGRLLSVGCSPIFLLRVQERPGAKVERNLTDGSKWVHV